MPAAFVSCRSLRSAVFSCRSLRSLRPFGLLGALAVSLPAAAFGQEAIPAAAATPVAAAATPVAAAAAPPPTRVATSPGEAVVHVAVNYREAWLETRNYVDSAQFVRTCPTPCDIKLEVDGLEARVTAPGMTTSNTFRFDAGGGRANVRIDGGSATARTAGIVSLAAGIPLALAGMALLGLGKLNDQTGLQAAGITALALGGTGVVVSLPLLLMGSTHVKSSRGTRIAGAGAGDPQVQ